MKQFVSEVFDLRTPKVIAPAYPTGFGRSGSYSLMSPAPVFTRARRLSTWRRVNSKLFRLEIGLGFLPTFQQWAQQVVRPLPLDGCCSTIAWLLQCGQRRCFLCRAP